MRFLSVVIALCSGSWMSIYLYGLYASHSVKYNHGLLIFPILMFMIVSYCFYREMKVMEKRSNEETKVGYE